MFEDKMKRALIITGEKYQDHELIYPYYRLRGEGFEVDIAAKERGWINGSMGTKMEANKAYRQMTGEDYSILVLPGGVKALEKIRQEKIVLDFINKWNSEGKTIASICHGAQLLISSNVVRGRKISGYYSIKDDIINAGAEYVDAPFVVDKNIISSPHYKYLGEWMNESLKQLSIKNDTKN